MLTAICSTDIVGSTARARSIGDAAWVASLRDHDELAARLVSAHGGTLVKRTGDGILATFPVPSAAAQALLQLRDQLAGRGIPIRAGVHVGEVDVAEDGDVHGVGVHIAARVAGLATAGQVLASAALEAVTVGSSLETTGRRSVELKGIGEWPIVEIAGA